VKDRILFYRVMARVICLRKVEPGPNFIIKNLPSVLILVFVDQT